MVDETPSALGSEDPRQGAFAETARDLVHQRLFGKKPAAGPREIGRYEVLEKIGEGGMGEVLRARDPQLDRTVAIKLLHPDFGRDDPDALARLEREARAMAKVSHPNVVAVYDAGMHDGQLYVAMEFVQGQTLTEWFTHEQSTFWYRDQAAKGARLAQQVRTTELQTHRPWEETVETMVQAARGLIAAHKAGFVHRDFKPENVMVGLDKRVRVLDFGLARTLRDGERRVELVGTDGNQTSPSVTQAGSIIGTPAYMAPEQHKGEPPDARSDQFAFCVALYEGLFGKRPFSGKTYQALVLAKCEGNYQDFPSDQEIPEHLRAVIRRGLQVDPVDRFSTMEDLVASMQAAPAPKWKRWPLWAAAAALLGVVSGGVALGSGVDECDELRGSPVGSALAGSERWSVFGEGWARTVEASCDGERSPEVLECLARWGAMMEQVIAVEPDRTPVRLIPPPRACEDAEKRGTFGPATVPERHSWAKLRAAQAFADPPPARPNGGTSRELAVLERLVSLRASPGGPEGLYELAARPIAAPELTAEAFSELARLRANDDPAAALELLRVGVEFAQSVEAAWLVAELEGRQAELFEAAGKPEAAAMARRRQLRELERLDGTGPVRALLEARDAR